MGDLIPFDRHAHIADGESPEPVAGDGADRDFHISITVDPLQQIGCEALARIRHAEVGDSPPDHDGATEQNEDRDDDVFERSMKFHVASV